MASGISRTAHTAKCCGKRAQQEPITVFDDLEGYRKIPLTSMPYGQAMAILALGEFKRTLT